MVLCYSRGVLLVVWFPFLLLLLLFPALSIILRDTRGGRGSTPQESLLFLNGLMAGSVPKRPAGADCWMLHPFPVSHARPWSVSLGSDGSRNATNCNSIDRGHCNSRIANSDSSPSKTLLPNTRQEAPCLLLGGGLSLNPALVFALAARRLLKQPLEKLTQGDSGPRAEAREAAAAAAIVCTPVTVEGGSGGDGSIAFLRLKAAPRSGAAGGCGGRGGCVLLRAVGPLDESSGGLRRFASLLESGCWRAASGATGAGQGKTGVCRTCCNMHISAPAATDRTYGSAATDNAWCMGLMPSSFAAYTELLLPQA